MVDLKACNQLSLWTSYGTAVHLFLSLKFHADCPVSGPETAPSVCCLFWLCLVRGPIRTHCLQHQHVGSRWLFFSPTPGSLGRFNISLINDLITAEALKGARRQAWIPNVRSKLAHNTMWRDFLTHALPSALLFSLCVSHLLRSAQCEVYSMLWHRNKLPISELNKADVYWRLCFLWAFTLWEANCS